MQIVGSVIDIDGFRLEFSRRSPSGAVTGWFQATRHTRTYLGDLFRTPQGTTATLEFLVGGRAHLAANSIYRIVSPKDVMRVEFYGSTAQLLQDTASMVWARFDKQPKVYQLGRSGIEG